MFKKIFGSKPLEKTTENSNILFLEAPKPKVYSSDIEEIHHAFESSSDKLLEEANEIFKRGEEKSVDKAKRLSNFGFSNAREVKTGLTIVKEVELTKETIKVINYYRKKYPKYKFITEENVAKICGKYGLVCGETFSFKGFVPEKNLIDIENFSLQKEDEEVLIGSEDTCSNVGSINWDGGKEAELYPSIRKRVTKTKPLFICAPLKDMNLTNKRINSSYRLEEIPKVIPDPIVLKEVKGGFLIVTAWGDEASDPLVVNEKHN